MPKTCDQGVLLSDEYRLQIFAFIYAIKRSYPRIKIVLIINNILSSIWIPNDKLFKLKIQTAAIHPNNFKVNTSY